MDSIAGQRPIALVTFDLYDTLVEMDVPRWERMATAIRRAGLAADAIDLRRHDRAAEDFFTIENGRMPIRDRSDEDREQFRLVYTATYLRAAGLPDDPDTVRRVRQYYVDEIDTHGWSFTMFEDVMPAVRRLEAHGVQRAVISNADADVTEFCLQMGFAPHMDVIVTSALVGYEKPDARTFYAALDALGVAPEDALHVGDQALSDVVGAQAIGMHAALIDRYHRHGADEHENAIVVHGLLDLVDLVLAHNEAVPVTP